MTEDYFLPGEQIDRRVHKILETYQRHETTAAILNHKYIPCVVELLVSVTSIPELKKWATRPTNTPMQAIYRQMARQICCEEAK